MTQIPKQISEHMAKQAAEFAGGAGKNGFEEYMIGWTDCYEYLLSLGDDQLLREHVRMIKQLESMREPAYELPADSFLIEVVGSIHGVFAAKLAQKDEMLSLVEMAKQSVINEQKQKIEKLQEVCLHVNGLSKSSDEQLDEAEQEIERLKEALKIQNQNVVGAAVNYDRINGERQKLAARVVELEKAIKARLNSGLPCPCDAIYTCVLHEALRGETPTAKAYFSEFKSEGSADVTLPKSREEIGGKDE